MERRRQFRLLNLLDLDLWKELTVDLTSIFVILYMTKMGGLLVHREGWMGIWWWLVDLANGDAHMLHVVGSLLVLLVVYWVPATIYSLGDMFRLYGYKVQGEAAQSNVDLSVLAKVVGTVGTNQVVFGLLGGETAYRHRYQYINMVTPLADVPSLSRMMVEICGFLIIFDIMFYYSHRLFHTKHLYPYHKSHHEWRAPIAAATALGHPVDFLMHCVLPVSLGPILLGSHLTTTWVWYITITLHELNDHSGYHLPWSRSPQAHDFHHKFGSDNYSNFSRLLDVLHGTDTRYRKSGMSWTRHERLLDLTPAHVRHPSSSE